MIENFHIQHPGPHVEQLRIPVTFYLSQELLADSAYTNADLADVLDQDLEAGIAHHREYYLSHGYDKPCTCIRTAGGGRATPIGGPNECPRHVIRREPSTSA